MAVIAEDGLWCDVRRAEGWNDGPALFLDRDGTLIDLVDYLADPKDVRLIDAAAQLVRRGNRAGIAVVIVTNQSGIGRGYYDWDAFRAVQDRIDALLAETGAQIDAVYACPHPPPSAGGPPRSAFRKPAPGMLLRANEDLSLDMGRSWVVGDSESDLAAGRAAGVSVGVLVETGYGTRDRVAAQNLTGDKFSVLHGLEALAGF